MKVDLDALLVLDAIVDAGSFAAAARRLHRTQSTVSYAIARLEQSLDLQVFDRSGHRAVLTDAGAVVLDEARALVHRARQLEARAARLRDGWEPRLDLIVDGVLPIAPILAVLRKLADDDLPTRIQVTMEFLGGVQHRFEHDGADIMLVKDHHPEPHHAARALRPVEMVLTCAADHPLARCGPAPLDRPALHEHVELSIHDSSPAARSDARLHGGPRAFHLSDFHAKKAALLAGLGFGWMPTALVQDELALGSLVELPAREGSRYAFTPMLVHRADRPPGRAARQLLDALALALA
ncbi:MAG: LysR family transcriptional regulator [Deltaproteobacteria bacterium]|nr:MAG: LysR family transcriptional regulator [Deltaproteobacteria bacterium]